MQSPTEKSISVCWSLEIRFQTSRLHVLVIAFRSTVCLISRRTIVVLAMSDIRFSGHQPNPLMAASCKRCRPDGLNTVPLPHPFPFWLSALVLCYLEVHANSCRFSSGTAPHCGNDRSFLPSNASVMRIPAYFGIHGPERSLIILKLHSSKCKEWLDGAAYGRVSAAQTRSSAICFFKAYCSFQRVINRFLSLE